MARGLPWGAEPETLCLFKCWLLEHRTKGVLQGCTAAKQLQRHCPLITSPFFISWISSQYLCLTLTFFCGKHFLFSAVFLIFLSFPSGRFCGKIEAPSRTCCFDRREITLFYFLVGASLSKLVRFFHSRTFPPSWKRSRVVILLPHGKWVLVLDFKAITGCICLHDTRKQYCKIGYRTYIQKKCPWQWASTFNLVFTIYRRSVVCINWLLRIHNLVQQWWRVKEGGGERACCERYVEMKQFTFCLCLCHWALNKWLSSERGFLRWKSLPVFPPSVILYNSKILPWF